MPAEAASTAQIAIDAAYLVTSVCFILGLRFLSHPKTARTGNRISMLGMAIALVATGFLLDWNSAWWVVAVGLGIPLGVGRDLRHELVGADAHRAGQLRGQLDLSDQPAHRRAR